MPRAILSILNTALPITMTKNRQNKCTVLFIDFLHFKIVLFVLNCRICCNDAFQIGCEHAAFLFTDGVFSYVCLPLLLCNR